jgi:hypothetical protein
MESGDDRKGPKLIRLQNTRRARERERELVVPVHEKVCRGLRAVEHIACNLEPIEANIVNTVPCMCLQLYILQ